MDVYTKHEAKYMKLRKGGASLDALAAEMVDDEREAVKAAELTPDARDRERVERAVAYGASELGVPMPRIRYYDGKGFDMRGVVFKAYRGEIWIDGNRPLREQVTVGLHELQHTAHFDDGQDHEAHEREAERFSRRGLYW